MKTILVPVDFSEISAAVIEQAIRLAGALTAKVTLLNVLQPPVIMSEYGPLLENIGEIMAAGEKVAAKRLMQLQEQLTQAGIAADTLQFTGAPVPSILEQAERLSADYIVMGSHGHTAFYDLLVGSTTHGVLMRSRCPVLIVPAPKKNQAERTLPPLASV